MKCMECRKPDIDACVDVMMSDVLKTTDSVLEDAHEEIDRLLTEGIPLSFNPQVLPDAFYKIADRRAFKKLFKYMESTFKTDFSLNWLNMSAIDDMGALFHTTNCNFDISRWDVSHVRNMALMFYRSSFDNDISSWDVSHVANMHAMFSYSAFNHDISNWKVKHDVYDNAMYLGCPIKIEYKAWPNDEV